MSVVWLLLSRAADVRERCCCACTMQVCVYDLPSVYIDCAGSMSLGRSRKCLFRDVKVRAEPRCVVVSRSSISCRGFQRGAREIDACDAGYSGVRNDVMWFLLLVMVLWGSFGWPRVGSRVTKCPPAFELRDFPLSL